MDNNSVFTLVHNTIYGYTRLLNLQVNYSTRYKQQGSVWQFFFNCLQSVQKFTLKIL
jgi:hypothetical protein